MTNLWDNVRDLQGQELITLRGKLFTLLSVTDTHAIVVPESTGKARPVRRQEIEAAALIASGSLGRTASAVREAGASEFNSIYVVAILKALPGSRVAETSAQSVAEALRRMATWQQASTQEN